MSRQSPRWIAVKIKLISQVPKALRRPGSDGCRLVHVREDMFPSAILDLEHVKSHDMAANIIGDVVENSIGDCPSLDEKATGLNYLRLNSRSTMRSSA